MHYFFLIPAALAAALCGTWLLGNRLRPLSDTAAQRIVSGFTILLFCIYFLLNWWKYGAFQCGLWDFGIYDSMMHNMASGNGFMQDYRGGLYDHFSPVMLLLVPFYRICDTPMHLLWFQSAVLAAGCPVMYFLARRYLPGAGSALVMALLYGLNPYYSRLVLYDFHSECIFPAVFLAGFLARACGKRKLAAILWMSCIFIKEDFAVPVAALGLYFLLFSRSERKTGLLLLGWNILAVILILKVYFPLLSSNGYWHYGRYPLFGETAAETLENILGMAGRLFQADSLVVFATLVLPFALLPLFHWKMLLVVAGPALAVQLVSLAPHQHLLSSHYGSALLGVMPLAALWGLRSFRRNFRRKKEILPRAVLFALIFGTVFHIACCELPMSRYHDYIYRWDSKLHGGFLSLPFRPDYYLAMLQTDIAAGELADTLERIPEGARAGMQNELGCPYLRKFKVYPLPGPVDADYYIFDHNLYSGFEETEKLNSWISAQLARPGYRMVLFEKGILIIGKEPLK